MRHALLPVLAALLVGCAKPPPRAPLGNWPETAPGWKQAQREYTRAGNDSRYWNEIVNVVAVLKTPRYRAAYVAEWQRRTAAGTEGVAKLTDSERQAADTTWTVHFFMATSNPQWNDLTKKDRSIWRLTLVGDDGREVVPSSIVADRRPGDEIRSWYPTPGPFHKAYVVTFPKKTADGHDLLGTQKKLTLRLGSGIANVALVWEEP
jgi:hypothetical protein